MMKIFVTGRESDASEEELTPTKENEAKFAIGFEDLHREMQVVRLMEKVSKSVEARKNSSYLSPNVIAFVILVNAKGEATLHVSSEFQTKGDVYALAGRLHAAAASLLKSVER